MMRTHVEFRSEIFPSYNDAVEGPNWETGVFGKRLADYLVAKLPAHGIRVRTHFAEDWGWCIEIEHEGGFAHFIGCGAYQEFENGYLCFIEPDKPVIRKWFKKFDVSAQIKTAADALDAILASDPAITAVRWWDEGER